MKALENKLEPHKSVIINHYEAGTYVIGKVYNEHIQ